MTNVPLCPICNAHPASQRSLREIIITGGDRCEALAIARIMGILIPDHEDPVAFLRRSGAPSTVRTRAINNDFVATR